MNGEGMGGEGIIPSNLADPKDKLVLIIDDDESILDLLDHVVKREGFRVEKAADGEEGLRKIHELKPDIIVLDFMLPGMGGFEVLKELQMSDAKQIPVLVITGRRIDPQTADMIRHESNVKDYVEKPIKPAVLMALLHRVLQTRPPEVKSDAGGGFGQQPGGFGQPRGGFGKRGSW
ncbi:MAG: response regulator [Elusimicrobiota bacterium]